MCDIEKECSKVSDFIKVTVAVTHGNIAANENLME